MPAWRPLLMEPAEMGLEGVSFSGGAPLQPLVEPTAELEQPPEQPPEQPLEHPDEPQQKEEPQAQRHPQSQSQSQPAQRERQAHQLEQPPQPHATAKEARRGEQRLPQLPGPARGHAGKPAWAWQQPVPWMMHAPTGPS